MEEDAQRNDGRKIPSKYENPFDNVLIDTATAFNPLLRRIGLTPNALTACAFVTGICAAYAAWQGRFIWAAIFTFVSYYFDVLDGNMARMFDMTTHLGDILDHASDITKYSLLILAVWNNKNPSSTVTTRMKFGFSCVMLVFFLLSACHMGCQEKSYDKNSSDTLSILEPLCPRASWITITRWFGVGTFVCVLMLLLVFTALTRDNTMKN